jgi:hypothetical protein
MNRQSRHLVFTIPVLLATIGSASLNAFATVHDNVSDTQNVILIAGAGQAGMGAQTAAQSSAASSAGSNASATTNSPATTPSSTSGISSPAQSAPSNISTPSFLPNSSSTSVSPATAPNGPATSGAPAASGSGNTIETAAPPNSINNFANGASRSGTNAPQLRGLIGAPGMVAPGKSENSVESFFQTNAAKSGPGYALIKSGETPSSSLGAPHSALWHIMDNLGIPVPTGSNVEALDPSLRRNYVNPALPEINNYKSRSARKQPLYKEAQIQVPPTQSAQQPVPTAINLQKIPESELEGVDFSAKNDDQSKQK